VRRKTFTRVSFARFRFPLHWAFDVRRSAFGVCFRRPQRLNFSAFQHLNFFCQLFRPEFFGTSTIFPNAPCSITARCASGACVRGSSVPITGRSVPFSKPATSAAWMLAFSPAVVLGSATPRMSASRDIASRGRDCSCYKRERGRIGRMRPFRKTSTVVFTCDKCGIRKRLDGAKRHWCENCTDASPIEMRAVRDRKPKLLFAA
jgi:hypothetical protein